MPPASAMQSWASDFGYELIEDDWKLTFPPPDPQLAQVVRRAIVPARNELAVLAALHPRTHAALASHHGNGEGRGRSGPYDEDENEDEDDDSQGTAGGGMGTARVQVRAVPAAAEWEPEWPRAARADMEVEQAWAVRVVVGREPASVWAARADMEMEPEQARAVPGGFGGGTGNGSGSPDGLGIGTGRLQEIRAVVESGPE